MNWAIGTPIREKVAPWFVYSLFDSMRWLSEAIAKYWEAFENSDSIDDPINYAPERYYRLPEWINSILCYPHKARSMIVARALSMELDGILWIDDDMQWSPQCVEAILSKAAASFTKPVFDKTIYGAFYPSRQEPDGVVGAYTDHKYPNGLYHRCDMDGCSIDYFGFGFVWTPISVFRAIDEANGADGSWFTDPGGEDVEFFRKARGLGYKLVRLDIPVSHEFIPGPRKLDDFDRHINPKWGKHNV